MAKRCGRGNAQQRGSFSSCVHRKYQQEGGSAEREKKRELRINKFGTVSFFIPRSLHPHPPPPEGPAFFTRDHGPRYRNPQGKGERGPSSSSSPWPGFCLGCSWCVLKKVRVNAVHVLSVIVDVICLTLGVCAATFLSLRPPLSFVDDGSREGVGVQACDRFSKTLAARQLGIRLCIHHPSFTTLEDSSL